MKRNIFLLILMVSWGQMALAQVQSANWNSNAQSWKVSPASWPCSGQAPPSFSGWQWNSSAGDGSGGMQVNYVRCTSPAQDSSFYMASPLVNLVAGNTYRVSIKSRAGTASTRKLRIGRNTTRFKAGSTQLLETANVGTSFATYTTDFTVPSTGNYSIIISGVFVANETAMLYADDYNLTLVNTPPSAISITAPSANGLFHTFTANTINTSWTDTENNVTKVEFFAGNTKLGEKTSSPWRFDWNPSIGGNYTLTAKATDAFGASLTSAGVSIRVNARPSLSLSYPPQTISEYFNCSNYVTPEDIIEGQYLEGPFLATANATDADGQVVKVDFYKNNVLLFTDTQAPWQYSYQMSAYDEGELLAIATDNDGATNADNYVQPLLYFGPISCNLYNNSNTLKQTLCLGDSTLLGSQPESLETIIFANSIQWQRNTGSGWTNVAGSGNSNACGNAPYQHEIYAKSGLYRAIWTLTNSATCTTQVDTVEVENPILDSIVVTNGIWKDGQGNFSCANGGLKRFKWYGSGGILKYGETSPNTAVETEEFEANLYLNGVFRMVSPLGCLSTNTIQMSWIERPKPTISVEYLSGNHWLSVPDTLHLNDDSLQDSKITIKISSDHYSFTNEASFIGKYYFRNKLVEGEDLFDLYPIAGFDNEIIFQTKTNGCKSMPFILKTNYLKAITN